MAPRLGRRRRRAARRAVVALLRQLPAFLRLLYRLFRDPRVSRFDKALVAAVLAYALTPADLIPDFLAFLGLVDDLYLIGLALNRLLRRAGPVLLLEHWDGTPGTLRLLLDGLDEVGSFVPRPVRRLLRARVPAE